MFTLIIIIMMGGGFGGSVTVEKFQGYSTFQGCIDQGKYAKREFDLAFQGYSDIPFRFICIREGDKIGNVTTGENKCFTTETD